MTTKIRCPIRPVSDKVVLERFEPDSVTAGGIHLPDKRAVPPIIRGRVLAVGPGRLCEDGSRKIDVEVKPGDVVLMHDWAGRVAEVGGAKYAILSADEILAVEGE
jgi:chaperonin GroES